MPGTVLETNIIKNIVPNRRALRLGGFSVAGHRL